MNSKIYLEDTFDNQVPSAGTIPIWMDPDSENYHIVDNEVCGRIDYTGTCKKCGKAIY